ncbi:MAG TPA: methyltransferase domain-containing protein, partial [Pyrinomonadaceae bacterium]|nr:methyltransferase domain-containing protein [Pyrinomonadaceae bacterium]
MKLAYFSPLSPQRSGISDYSEELLPYLAEDAEITLFVDGFAPTNPDIVSRFEICDYRKQPAILKQLSTFDAVIYHMGNDHRYHTGIFETMMKSPGIAVLHDFVLQDFFLNLAQTRKDMRLYLDEVGACYGDTVKAAASEALASGATPRIAANPVRFPLNDRIVRAAKGVIVHSHWSRQRLAAICPGALVQTIPHHITETAASARHHRPVTNAAIRIASFGLITPNKGIERALRALSSLRDQHDFKYVLVGEANPYFDVRELIRNYGLEDRVEITGHVDLAEFQKHIFESDIAINLREQVIGETSGSLCRIMAAGVPAIVSNSGWFGELPNDAVVKLDMGRHDDALLKAYLTALIVDGELRREIGGNARRHVLAHNDIRDGAKQYLAFIARVIDERPEQYLVDTLAKEIGMLGMKANGDEVLSHLVADVAPLVSGAGSARLPLPLGEGWGEGSTACAKPSLPAPLTTGEGSDANGRLRKLDGVDYKQAAVDYVGKLDPERRHYLFTKPFYNLANKPPKHAGEGMDAETFRHFCDFANIAVALALPAGSTILDVGCGSGWLSEYFARLGYVVKGIDISPELIEMSRDRIARIPYDVDHETTLRCQFEVHDIEHAPLNEQFDGVVCYDSLHHFEDERAVIAHLAAATKYGGSLFILEGDRPPSGSATEDELIDVMRRFGTLESPFSRDYLRDLLDENGFAVIGDYTSVNGLFERESLEDDWLRVRPPEVNYLLCKKVVHDPGRRASTVPDSRNPNILRARFELLTKPPGRVAPGKNLSFSLSIENCGDTLWLTSSTPRKGIVMPAVRVFDEAGLLVTEFHGEPLLPHAVAPSESVRIKIEYKAPSPPGSYRLKIDLVDQQVAWFEERGS